MSAPLRNMHELAWIAKRPIHECLNGCTICHAGAKGDHGRALSAINELVERLKERDLCVSILTKIAEQADHLSTEGESGSIRIDSWIEGFTSDEIALLRKLHGRTY